MDGCEYNILCSRRRYCLSNERHLVAKMREPHYIVLLETFQRNFKTSTKQFENCTIACMHAELKTSNGGKLVKKSRLFQGQYRLYIEN